MQARQELLFSDGVALIYRIKSRLILISSVSLCSYWSVLFCTGHRSTEIHTQYDSKKDNCARLKKYDFQDARMESIVSASCLMYFCLSDFLQILSQKT